MKLIATDCTWYSSQLSKTIKDAGKKWIETVTKPVQISFLSHHSPNEQQNWKLANFYIFVSPLAKELQKTTGCQIHLGPIQNVCSWINKVALENIGIFKKNKKL